MNDIENYFSEIDIKQKNILDVSFDLFSKYNIHNVTMNQIAEACDVGISTLYRLYNNKVGLVVAVSIYKWKEFLNNNFNRLKKYNYDKLTAFEEYVLFLDTFLYLYKKHKDILRFNQFFNVFIKTEKDQYNQITPYINMIKSISNQFHRIYSKALEDCTLRTDVSEETMFTSTLHIMLAVITRHAVGLVYIPKDKDSVEQELVILKNMFLKEFKGSNVR
jgi:AcrR family transcriptional regulator